MFSVKCGDIMEKNVNANYFSQNKNEQEANLIRNVVISTYGVTQ